MVNKDSQYNVFESLMFSILYRQKAEVIHNHSLYTRASIIKQLPDHGTVSLSTSALSTTSLGRPTFEKKLAKRWWYSAAGKVTAGLTESHGSLPPNLWLKADTHYPCSRVVCTGLNSRDRWIIIYSPNARMVSNIMTAVITLCPIERERERWSDRHNWYDTR